MAEQTQGHLEVTNGQGQSHRVPIAGTRLIIGRSVDVPVHLESATVSRQHAELFCDPFGRWWVRDLKSRNGTFVNGTQVAEDRVHSGDLIQIEDFKIVFNLTMPSTPGVPGAGDGAPGSPRTSAPKPAHASGDLGVTLMDGELAGSPVRRLRDLEAPKISNAHIEKLTEFSTTLHKTKDPAERLKKICQLMISPEFHGTTALALRLNREQTEVGGVGPQVLTEPLSARKWRAGEQPYVSKTLMREVRRIGAPVVASNQGTGGGGVELSLAGNVQSMSAIACPIASDDTSLDVLYVTFPGEFGTSEWLALAALAAGHFQQASATWTARQQGEQAAIIEEELGKAARIQMRLIPRELENIEGLDIAIGFEPCKWVGGDYVDVMPSGEGKMLLAVADVCGKGMQAALITTSVHAAVHTNAMSSTNLKDIMQRLNEYLCSTLPDESFVTMMGILLDVKTGQFECINAGHPPALIVDPQGNVRQLQSATNLPLGYMPVEMEVSTDTLPPGHLLAVYTDGCNEMVNEAGDMLGIDKLEVMAKDLYTGQSATLAKELGDRFKKLLDTFQGNAMPADDRTFLLVRRKA